MTDQSPSTGKDHLSKIDTSTPHSARVWNYWLGGKDNFKADRELAQHLSDLMPELIGLVRSVWDFRRRVVQYLTADAGMRQFVDIGAGLPAAGSTHEIAQAIAPESRVVYVDDDPVVLVHARAILTSTTEGAVDIVDGDIHNPLDILMAARRTLDFRQPIAIMLLDVLSHIADDEVYSIVRQLVESAPAGSYVVINHLTSQAAEAANELARNWDVSGTKPVAVRSSAKVARFFDGLELVEPGIVDCSQWRSDSETVVEGADPSLFGGVGRKPVAGDVAKNSTDKASAGQSIRVDVYLDTDDEQIAERVVVAANRLAQVLGYEGVVDEETLTGSIWRKARASLKQGISSEEVSDRLAKVERAIELKYLELNQAEVDSKEAEAVATLINSLTDVPQACIRVGSILLVKYMNSSECVVVCRSMSQAEIRAFERFPEIQLNPRNAVVALKTAVESMELTAMDHGSVDEPPAATPSV
jgi:hypothetical protein